MKRCIFLVWLLLLGLATSLPAQSGDVELEQRIRAASGIERVRLLNRLAAMKLDKEPGRAITVSLQALDEIANLERELKEGRKALDPAEPMTSLPDPTALIRAEASSHNVMGRAYRQLADRRKAIDHFRQGYRFSRRSGYREGEDVALAQLRELDAGTGLGNLLSETLESTGVNESVREASAEIQAKYLEGAAHAQEEKGRYEAAIENYVKSIRFYEELDDSLKLAEVYSRIAVLQNELGDQAKAITYYELADKAKGRGQLIGVNARISDSVRTGIANSRIRVPVTLPTLMDSGAGKVFFDTELFSSGTSRATVEFESSAEFKESYDRLKKRLETIYAKGQSDSLIRAMMIQGQRIKIDSLQQERELQLLAMEQQEAEMRRKETQQLTLLAGLVLILIIAGILYALFLTKKRSHNRLAGAYNKLDAAHQQLKATQLQLVEAEKMASLGQLTAGIAHEINNPLNFISSNISPLRRDIQDLTLLIEAYEAAATDPSQLSKATQLGEELEREFLQEEIRSLLVGIEEGASRTAEIVQGLRDFSRLNEDMPKPFLLHDSLNDALSLLRNLYEGRIVIDKRYATDLPAITGLAGKINQVLYNVLQNAIEAIQGEGEIRIETLKTGNEACISIADNGTGMAPNVAQKAFDPFFTTKDVGQGKGLGLAICHGIVRQHHGHIDLRSEPGKGTVVEIFLPLSPKADLRQQNLSGKINS